MSDDRLKRIEDRLERMDENLSDVAVVLARNTASLEEHMRRSDALETYVRQVDNHVKENVVKEEIEPIKKHVNQVTWAVRGIFWFLGIAASVVVFLRQFGVI